MRKFNELEIGDLVSFGHKHGVVIEKRCEHVSSAGPLSDISYSVILSDHEMTYECQNLHYLQLTLLQEVEK